MHLNLASPHSKKTTIARGQKGLSLTLTFFLLFLLFFKLRKMVYEKKRGVNDHLREETTKSWLTVQLLVCMGADRHLSWPLNFYFFCWGEKEKARNSVYKKAITPLLSRPEEPRLGRGAVASWLMCLSPDRAVWV